MNCKSNSLFSSIYFCGCMRHGKLHAMHACMENGKTMSACDYIAATAPEVNSPHGSNSTLTHRFDAYVLKSLFGQFIDASTLTLTNSIASINLVVNFHSKFNGDFAPYFPTFIFPTLGKLTPPENYSCRTGCNFLPAMRLQPTTITTTIIAIIIIKLVKRIMWVDELELRMLNAFALDLDEWCGGCRCLFQLCCRWSAWVSHVFEQNCAANWMYVLGDVWKWNANEKFTK